MSDKKDCGMIDLCRQFGQIYSVCKADSPIIGGQCSVGQKMTIKILASVDEKLSSLLKNCK